MSKHKFSNILLTGAAGALGEQLRKTLSQNCNLLRISDKEKLVKKFKNEEVNQANLSSAEAMIDLTKNIDCVVHMGGQSIEGSWKNVCVGKKACIFHIGPPMREIDCNVPTGVGGFWASWFASEPSPYPALN